MSRATDETGYVQPTLDQLIAAREALRVQATHDPLTGLWNHAAILDILGRSLVAPPLEVRVILKWVAFNTGLSWSRPVRAAASSAIGAAV